MGSNETSAQEAYNQFWPKATEEIRAMGAAGLKHQELPLARIKKVFTFEITGRRDEKINQLFFVIDHETRRRCENDKRRGSRIIRQGG